MPMVETSRSGLEPIRPIYWPACNTFSETGRVTIPRLKEPALDHHLCHLAAGRRLVEEVDKNPILCYRLALGREQTRLRHLTEKRQKLERRALELDVDMAIRRIQVQSLEEAIIDLGQTATEEACAIHPNGTAQRMFIEQPGQVGCKRLIEMQISNGSKHWESSLW